MLLFLALACTSTPEPTDTDTGSLPVVSLAGTLRFAAEWAYDARIAGIQVEMGRQEGEVGDDGAVELAFTSGERFTVDAEGTDINDLRIEGRAGQEDFELTVYPTIHWEPALILDVAGLVEDESLGWVWAVFEDEDGEGIEGVKVEIDLDAQMSFPVEPNIQPGKSTGPQGAVGIANVSPGQTPVHVTLPEGVECSLEPGGGELGAITVEADRHSFVRWLCSS